MNLILYFDLLNFQSGAKSFKNCTIDIPEERIEDPENDFNVADDAY